MSKQVDKAEQHAQNMETAVQEKERRHNIWSSTHGFIMLRTNNPQSTLPYYVIRRERAKIFGIVKKMRAKHPHSAMIYQNMNVANPINLYIRLKASGILCFKGNYCKSLVNETDLITKLGDLYCVL